MNRSLYGVSVILWCLFSAFCAAGQDLPALHYTVEDGLPSNTVYCVYRDSRDFIWIATDKGVARFNGIRFETFSTSNGLPDNEIFFIQQDKNDRVWLGAFNGELCYYKDDSFHTAADRPFLALPFKTSHTKHISVEYDSSLIISFFDGGKFVTIDKERKRIFYLDSLHDPDIAATLIFRKKVGPNCYKLICADKIVFIDTQYHILDVQKVAEKFKNPWKLFCGCQDQEYMFNHVRWYTVPMDRSREFPAHFIDSNYMNEIYEDGSRVFYTTSKGVFVNDTLHILRGNNASAMTQDDRGNYWFSTLNNGIFGLRSDFLRTKIYRQAYTNQVKNAYTFGDHAYFVTEGNDLYQIAGGKVSTVFLNKDKGTPLPVEYGFTIDSDRRVYYCFDKKHLEVYDLLTKQKKVLIAGPDMSVKALLLSGNCIYMKLGHSITRMCMANYSPVGSARDIGRSPDNERIFGMAKAPDNAIWYSTVGSMYRVTNDDTDGVPQPQFRDKPLKSFEFFGDYLVGYTQNNRLIICRNFNSSKMTMDSIANRNCVWDKFYRINDSSILVSTNNLYRLLTIGKAHGHDTFIVRSVESQYIPIHAEAVSVVGDNCYFFKNEAITVVDKNSILRRPDPPEVHFMFLKTNKRMYPVSGEMEIPFSESKHINIRFSTQSFSAHDVLYQYSISRSEQDNWRDLQGEDINFVNTEYGTYQVKVRVRSFSSDYSAPISFILHISRPYWATWWFVTLFAIAITLMTGFAVRFRIAQVLRKKEKEHDTEIKFMKSEYKALNALMNPHFIFNTLNNVQGLVNKNDKAAANEYIRIFADLIRQNMKNISKEFIPLQKEMDLVANYLLLEKLRFKDHLNYSINVQEGLDLSEVIVPPLLVQPLVENSIKHGILPMESPDGQIIIDIYESGGRLHIDVKDNGVGMQASAANNDLGHESIGLKNVRKRIEQLGIMQNKTILFHIGETKDAAGSNWTTVSIAIPV